TKVANIMQADSERKSIRISAPGRRSENDYSSSGLLLRFAKAYIEKDKSKSYFITVMERFQKITEALGLSDDIMKEIEKKILSTMNSNIDYDDKINAFKAIGEDSSARILSAYLTSIGIQAEYVNPKDAGIIVEKDPLGAKLLPESN